MTILRWRFHTTQAKLDDKSLVNNGTKKEIREQMEGHASLMYFTEEVRHNTFPLKLLQSIVSQGEELQFTFCLWKNRGIQQLEQ